MAENHPDVALAGVLRELAALAGDPGEVFEDEHDRWRLYQSAAEVPSARLQLMSAIAAEPVPTVASAAVVMLLDQTERQQRGHLIGLLDPAVREFPEKRARELNVLESRCEAGDAVSIHPNEIETWSDWLQFKVADSCRDPHVLGLLAEHGRTRRIRRSARQARISQ